MSMENRLGIIDIKKMDKNAVTLPGFVGYS